MVWRKIEITILRYKWTENWTEKTIMKLPLWCTSCATILPTLRLLVHFYSGPDSNWNNCWLALNNNQSRKWYANRHQFTKRGILGLFKFNPATCYWSACAKPRKWSVVYMCVRCIDFAFFYDFDIWFWNSSDGVDFLFFIQILDHYIFVFVQCSIYLMEDLFIFW